MPCLGQHGAGPFLRSIQWTYRLIHMQTHTRSQWTFKMNSNDFTHQSLLSWLQHGHKATSAAWIRHPNLQPNYRWSSCIEGNVGMRSWQGRRMSSIKNMICPVTVHRECHRSARLNQSFIYICIYLMKIKTLKNYIQIRCNIHLLSVVPLQSHTVT